jgi:hypothetical protein
MEHFTESWNIKFKISPCNKFEHPLPEQASSSTDKSKFITRTAKIRKDDSANSFLAQAPILFGSPQQIKPLATLRNPFHSSGTLLLRSIDSDIHHFTTKTVMSSSLPSKLPHREHLVGSANWCADHSPDLRSCAVPGDGHPTTTVSSFSSARPVSSLGNHYHIAFTNQAGKKTTSAPCQPITAMVTAPHQTVPGILPTQAPNQRPISHLSHDDLRRTLATKRARTSPPPGNPAPADQIPPVSFTGVSLAPKAPKARRISESVL